MAAAVLGHAAWRLGGGALRQTQEAAVARLSSRFAHAEAKPGCSCGRFDKDAVFKGIQRKTEELKEAVAEAKKKTEELYDAMAEAHRKYGEDKDSASRVNRAFLRELSGHVGRRSGDPTWEWARKSQARYNLVKGAGYVTLVVGGTHLSLKALAWAVGEA
ncbi:unnamed protein product [Alopecurus aequalis]